MTRMSDPRTETVRAVARLAVARALHIACAAMFTGCVIPPSLQVDTADAGVNSPPSILAVRADNTELPELKTLVFEQGPNAGTVNLTLYDTDVDDTLFVRVFVDYNNPDPTPPRSGCESGAHTARRSCTAEMNGVCQTADIGQTRVLQFIVFDQELLDFGLPLYQHMKEGGLQASRTYFLKCQAASS